MIARTRICQGQGLMATAASIVTFLGLAAILYYGRSILVPIAVAILLTFILSPLVARLCRIGIPRVLSVIIVVLFAATVISVIGWIITSELHALITDVPRYRTNIREKIHDLRQFGRGNTKDIEHTIEEVSDSLQEESPETLTEDREPVPVRVVSGYGILPVSFTMAVTPLLRLLATVGLVSVLAVFMLIQRADLRNRIVSLAGSSRLAITTKALDEVGRRISRYLLMQLIINTSFGFGVGLGLLLLGIPHALLWGFCAALFRYVPYVGPWVAALLPITVSLITFSGWTKPLVVISLFVVLELISNNIMEPLLYGRSIGVSAVAFIVSAVCWTWLWGAVGLILAAPMTICLVVIGRYVPGLAFLDRLLADTPALDAPSALYQRLLARDLTEALEIFENHLTEHGTASLFDDLLLPALVLAKRDRKDGVLDEDDEEVIAEVLDEILEVFVPDEDCEEVGDDTREPSTVLAVPSRDKLGRAALEIIATAFFKTPCHFEVLSPHLMSADLLVQIRAKQPAVICFAILSSADVYYIRLIAKRIRHEFPEQRMVVGYWVEDENSESLREMISSAGVDVIETQVSELKSRIVPLARFHNGRQPAKDHGQRTPC